ncbi:hypothetical protein B0T10DRAFT_465617 [Thelonectria olida]|uniref:Heterokaryon incompatibility protein n=1 Tax=Thelonectria olida TaxID=1576542 RepID=A0A9P9AJH6_9HYPO|nr:hypothetical protein B0T10DRAFT_465617 [Thelonectria olida]
MARDITMKDSCPARSFVENVVVRLESFRCRDEDATQKQTPFITVLSTSLALECDYNHPLMSDPRDRADADDFSTFPDYSKTCGEVYTEAAVYFLRQGHIDTLIFCQSPRELSALPSWVPDWSMHADRVLSPRGRASSPRRGTLNQVKPFFVDAIKEFGQVWDPDWLRPLDPNAALAFVNDILSFCKKSTRVKFPNDTAGSFVDDLNYYVEVGKALQAKADSGSSDTQEREGDRWSEDADWFMLSLHRLHSCRPFLSSQGFVGLCPSHVQPGDEICVMLGAEALTLLRPRGDGSYSVVGEAYVHGIMFGEMLKGDLHIETILLR